jgi:hypothetical protein
MNAPSASALRRRRRWPWILAVLLVSPLLLLAVSAASFLTLGSDAAALRREVTAATRTEWKTKIQVSVGRLSLWCVRQGMQFAPGREGAEARAALAAVESVSIGIYRPVAVHGEPVGRSALVSETDRAMIPRGWTRVVAAGEPGGSNVLIYVRADADEVRDVCLAVIGRGELVVVSATVDAEALAGFVARHAEGRLRLDRGLRMARSRQE